MFGDVFKPFKDMRPSSYCMYVFLFFAVLEWNYPTSLVGIKAGILAALALVLGIFLKCIEWSGPIVTQIKEADKQAANPSEPLVTAEPNAVNEDAYRALCAMGVKKGDAVKAIQLAQNTLGNNKDTNAIIVEALRSKK